MTLLWIDGFEGYGTGNGNPVSPANVFTRRYAYAVYGTWYCTLAPGRISGWAIQAGNASWAIQTPNLTTDSTLIAGIGFQPMNATGPVITFYDGTQRGVWLQYNPSSSSTELQVYRDSTLLGTTSGAGLAFGTWAYVELKVLCDASSGSVAVHVNGSTVLTLSGQNTKAGADNYHNNVGLSIAAGFTPLFDDLYVCDSTGSLNHNFLGNVKVVAIFPDANGDVNAWTGSGGSAHYTYVDENPVDDDTTHVESATSGQEELWDYATPSVGAVLGVQVNTDCRVTDVTTFTLDTQIKSSGTDSSDAGQAVTSTNYVTKMRISQTDPATSSPWTPTAVSAAQFGVKVG